MTVYVICFKIFCDGLFFFNGFFEFSCFIIFQSFNFVDGGVGQMFIFIIRGRFGCQDFSKIFFHKNFFIGPRKKIFVEFDFSMNSFSSKIIFSQERRNHKLKKIHVTFFYLQFFKIVNFETVSNSDLYFAQCKMRGVGKFHQKAILCVQRADKICACDLRRRSVFYSLHFVYLKLKLKKIFGACDKIF